MIYGYCRISTTKQSITRQIANIKTMYPDIEDKNIFKDSCTGTTLDRPQWKVLYKLLNPGDTIIFDEVSRMSRDAEEGFKLYKELFNNNINLIFIKESTLNTDVFRDTQQIASVGNEIADIYIKATNEVLMILAEQQIKKAFETAQHEVDFLHKRTSEGVQNAQRRYHQETILGIEHTKELPGRKQGVTIETKKAKETKKTILKLSKDFNGTNTDAEVIKITGLARNTYYKYKKELKAE